jgi:hypothetical protein
MAYTRVWIPELNAYKIIGEISGEEALQLSATIPEGSTQWGWSAGSGTFAYGTSEESRQIEYESPEYAPGIVPTILIDTAPGIQSPGWSPEGKYTPPVSNGGTGGNGATRTWTPPPETTPTPTNLPAMVAGIGVFGALCLAMFAFRGKRK